MQLVVTRISHGAKWNWWRDVWAVRTEQSEVLIQSTGTYSHRFRHITFHLFFSRRTIHSMLLFSFLCKFIYVWLSAVVFFSPLYSTYPLSSSVSFELCPLLTDIIYYYIYFLTFNLIIAGAFLLAFFQRSFSICWAKLCDLHSYSSQMCVIFFCWTEKRPSKWNSFIHFI